MLSLRCTDTCFLAPHCCFVSDPQTLACSYTHTLTLSTSVLQLNVLYAAADTGFSKG